MGAGYSEKALVVLETSAKATAYDYWELVNGLRHSFSIALEKGKPSAAADACMTMAEIAGLIIHRVDVVHL